MKKEDMLKRKITKVVEITITIVFFIFLIVGVKIWNSSELSSQPKQINVEQKNISNLDNKSEQNFVIVLFDRTLHFFNNSAFVGNNFIDKLAEFIFSTIIILILIFSEFIFAFLIYFLARNIFLPVRLIARPITFLAILFGKRLGWFQDSQEQKSLYLNGSLSSKMLKISAFLYSKKTHEQVFKPFCGDWEEEWRDALFKKEFKRAYWINVRDFCTFLVMMIQRTPVKDLIEFIKKGVK